MSLVHEWSVVVWSVCSFGYNAFLCVVPSSTLVYACCRCMNCCFCLSFSLCFTPLGGSPGIVYYYWYSLGSFRCVSCVLLCVFYWRSEERRVGKECVP